jgi:lysine 2,3-aminomutase
MKLSFAPAPRPSEIPQEYWQDWRWQMRTSAKTAEEFHRWIPLSREERQAFAQLEGGFKFQTTPYYASLVDPGEANDPIRKILMPQVQEKIPGVQQMRDPLGEVVHSPVPRIIHRYPDRLLFLVTDMCSVYCRYCTRKHFTGQDRAFAKQDEYEKALDYIRSQRGLREVILSGGDPLTLGDSHLLRVLEDLRKIEHIEIIRIGTRIPVVNPMRVTNELVEKLKQYHPIFLMVHFNHPRELTAEAAEALRLFVDNGFPVMNQMVLLNGVNNHEVIVQALSRRLLYLRVKPYYMFQCDPSEGTDHLRISVEESLHIQRELWGRLSGLAMPQLSLDIPDGGGKVGLVPDFILEKKNNRIRFQGWDGRVADYISPDRSRSTSPVDVAEYLPEWEALKNTHTSRSSIKKGPLDSKGP